MCESCPTPTISRDHHDAGRRSFMKWAAAGLALSSLPALGGEKFVPKPENVISPDAALARLMAGNERYVRQQSINASFSATRAALARGQNPYACVLSCADSRIGPELCFDSERGDLFVTRVAGNYVTPQILASLEYGTAVLNAPLIMVLGHTNCGAIKATIDAVTKNAAFPGHIQTITTDLSPAIRSALKKNPAQAEQACVLENVRLNVENLKNANPLLSARVASGQLKVVGAVYDLSTGRVTLA